MHFRTDLRGMYEVSVRYLCLLWALGDDPLLSKKAREVIDAGETLAAVVVAVDLFLTSRAELQDSWISHAGVH